MSAPMDNASPAFLTSLPLDVLKSLPGKPAPPGVQPNYDNPATRVPIILGVSSVFLGFASICFLIRIYMKIVLKRWKWDDLTCSLGFICSLVYFAAAVIGCVHGPIGRHSWDVHLDEMLSKANTVSSFMVAGFSIPAVGLIKISLFIQYYLLFGVMRYVRISVYIGATLSAIFYFSITITAFVLCSPWHGESFAETLLSWHLLKFSDFSVPIGVVGMVIDITLLVIPIPAIWNLRLSLARRLGVLLVFATGGLAAVASIVTLYYRIKLWQLANPDPSWNLGYMILWSHIEMFAGVAASSMPIVRLFFARMELFKSWTSSSEPEPAPPKSISPGAAEKQPASHKSGFRLWGFRSDLGASEHQHTSNNMTGGGSEVVSSHFIELRESSSIGSLSKASSKSAVPV